MVNKLTLPSTDNAVQNKINEIIDNIPEIDNLTITQNSDDELQTVAVIDQNSGYKKVWTGTRQQYDAILTKDANTLYNITDDTDVTLSLLDALYPVGSIYIGTMQTCPLATLGVGTWQLVAADRVLQGAGTGGNAGDTKAAGLPNIVSSITAGAACYYNRDGGALYTSDGGDANIGGTNWQNKTLNLNLSRSNAIYGNSNTVQPPAYLVNIWERLS